MDTLKNSTNTILIFITSKRVGPESNYVPYLTLGYYTSYESRDHDLSLLSKIVYRRIRRPAYAEKAKRINNKVIYGNQEK